MININLGGCKGFKKFSKEIQEQWKLMDSCPSADYVFDINRNAVIDLPSDSVDNYYSSHTLEHAYTKKVIPILKELRRTLKPLGVLRIVVPDISVGIDYYIKKKKHEGFHPYKPDENPCTGLGYLMGWFHTPSMKRADGHNTAFDKETLTYYLKEAGFKQIRFLMYGECSKVFIGKDFKRYASYSLYVEVTK